MSSPNQSQPDNWYSRLVARLYDPITKKMEERFLARHRRRLLSGLTGSILEVGAGTGANFHHYPAGASVIAVEPSLAMLDEAQRKVDRGVRADFLLVHAGIGDEHLAQFIPDEGFDAVVFTLVLCTVPDPAEALARVKPWLKRTGKLFILEHIAAREKTAYWMQRVANPLWKPLAEGCHLTRHTDDLLRQQGFRPIEEAYFTKGLPFYQAVMEVG